MKNKTYKDALNETRNVWNAVSWTTSWFGAFPWCIYFRIVCRLSYNRYLCLFLATSRRWSAAGLQVHCHPSADTSHWAAEASEDRVPPCPACSLTGRRSARGAEPPRPRCRRPSCQSNPDHSPTATERDERQEQTSLLNKSLSSYNPRLPLKMKFLVYVIPSAYIVSSRSRLYMFFTFILFTFIKKSYECDFHDLPNL